MNYAYEMEQPLAIRATQSERAGFIRRTYLHLAGALLALVAIDFVILTIIPPQQIQSTMMSLFQNKISILVLLASFIGVGYVARWWAYNGTSQAMAYAGLVLYVVFMALWFIPTLFVAIHYTKDPTILPTAAILTLSIFGGLTAAAFVTKKDFSFLGPILSVVTLLMIGLIVAGLIFGFTIGLWFSFLGVAVMSGFILYDTSNIIHKFRTDMHVAAALELFASVAILFLYIMDILMSLSSGRRD